MTTPTSKPPTPPDDEPALRARLTRLNLDIEASRKVTAEAQTRQTSEVARGQEAGRMMSLGFRMVSELIGGILVGLGIGWGLDRIFNSSPIFLIVFSLLGTAAGFWNVIRAASPPRGPGKAGEDG